MSLAAVASIAAPIFGGLFGKKQPEQKWITPNYGEIRAKAEAAGFNPLTALQSASGGIGSAGSSGFNFGDAVASGLSSYAQYDQQQTQLDLEQTALDQRERELQLRERQFGKPVAAALTISPGSKTVEPVETLGVPSGTPLDKMRPAPRPSPENDLQIPVYNLAGGAYMMNKRVADRNNIGPFDVVQGGDNEEMLGEIGGNLATAPQLPKAAGTIAREDGWGFKNLVGEGSSLKSRRDAAKFNPWGRY